jgi:1,4-alpha-glucan branching enzyme
VSLVGAFTFVLHTHLPYARLAGRWPHGEEWIHEAATETYIPLLSTLHDLYEEGVPFRLTLGITPVLAEQLADADVLDHIEQYLDERIGLAISDMAYFEVEETADDHLRELAEWYRDWFNGVRTAFISRFKRDIIGGFRRLQEAGCIEIITSAATHAYLPLLSRDTSIAAQLKTAVRSYERLFGRRPTGVWLPECAYRPAYVTETGKQRPGLETFLADYGLRVFFSETHTITGGQPVGVAAGEVIGPYGYVKRRYVIPASPIPITPERPATTYQPYYVSESIAGVNARQHSSVVVIGRNNETGMQVWSADWGYPGDFDYREFHKKAGTSGLQYWRVTAAKSDLADKDYYYPEWAAAKIEQHAEHFARLASDLLHDYHAQTGQFGLIASNYDTELFGHWWFEGVTWLGKVLRHLAQDSEIELTTATEFINRYPPTEILHIPEGSWGSNGTHFTWDNGDTHWMWRPIHEAEETMERMVVRFPDPTDDEKAVLNQAARELLLLQGSDWPFLVTTGQAREYAIQRFSQHLERFNTLIESVKKGRPKRAQAEEYWELDNVFPDIDYRWFSLA